MWRLRRPRKPPAGLSVAGAAEAPEIHPVETKPEHEEQRGPLAEVVEKDEEGEKAEEARESPKPSPEGEKEGKRRRKRRDQTILSRAWREPPGVLRGCEVFLLHYAGARVLG